MSHAPAGGAYGVNNEWYAGGQFMPTMDLPKQHKRAVMKHVTATRNIAEIIVETSGAVKFVEAGSSSLKHVTFCNTHTEAVHLANFMLEEKKNWYAKQGLQPHPTELVIQEVQ